MLWFVLFGRGWAEGGVVGWVWSCDAGGGPAGDESGAGGGRGGGWGGRQEERGDGVERRGGVSEGAEWTEPG